MKKYQVLKEPLSRMDQLVHWLAVGQQPSGIMQSFLKLCFDNYIEIGLEKLVSRGLKKLVNRNNNSEVRFDDDLFRNIISGSPVLETLVLGSCYGFEVLDISNDSVKNFVICGSSSEMDTLRINAPHIESLTIKEMHEHYQMNEELFKGLILSLSHVKELKVGKSCLEVLASLKSKGFKCPSNMKVFEEIATN
nr:hypothetical protein [Tanacetum cinerariifolium]